MSQMALHRTGFFLRARMIEEGVLKYIDEIRRSSKEKSKRYKYNGEFDPGSGRTLAARLTHASRTDRILSGMRLVANG